MKTKTNVIYPTLAALAVSCFAPLPLAKATSTDQVVIYGATANLTTHLLNVSGANFGSTTPTVMLDNTSLTVTSSSPTTIQATLPSSITPGSYLLTVSTGTGATFNAIFDVTAVNGNSGSEDRGNGNSGAENVNALNPATTGTDNTAHGWNSLSNNTTGNYNTANGFNSLTNNIGGSNNAATGYFSLFMNTTGSDNTAMGYTAMYNNGSGEQNTAYGSGALVANTSGVRNTATGVQALYFNGASYNAAYGALALSLNNSGDANTAVGTQALYSNNGGRWNTATGYSAMVNGNGSFSVADGAQALGNNQGTFNTAVGNDASLFNTSGNGNTAVGHSALQNNTTGNSNIGIGDGGGSNLDGSNNIAIGNSGVSGDNNTIRIGTTGTQTATFVAGISGTAVVGTNVVVDGTGQLGVLVSSARFKDHVAPMDKASEAILALHPVTFSYKEEVDPNCAPQFGLIAEDVEKVNPDLVVRDSNGKPFTVRYEAVNAMLLNEFLKERQQVQEQQKQIEKLTAQLKEQAEEIRKVNDKVEMNRTEPQIVVNHR